MQIDFVTKYWNKVTPALLTPFKYEVLSLLYKFFKNCNKIWPFVDNNIFVLKVPLLPTYQLKGCANIGSCYSFTL